MLAYTSQPYEEAMAMHPVVTYTPYATYLREQAGNIIKFAQFEEEVYFLTLMNICKLVPDLMEIPLCLH